MRAVETQLLRFLSKADTQCTIPIYQRTYSWKKQQCDQLWKDILYTGSSGDVTAHFIGSIVYISNEETYQVTGNTDLRVIDGQQRLTTVVLILEALARRLGDNNVTSFSAAKIRNTYLMNQYAKAEYCYKLRLTQTDNDSLNAIVQQKEDGHELSLHIAENFNLFTKKIAELEDDSLENLCRGLNKLTIVDIALTRGEDNPQRIFESMNSTGLDLSKADLIRNFVLMNLDDDHQRSLYEEHWRPMEISFGQRDYEKHFDKFIRYYLILKTEEIPIISKVYEDFKKYSERAYVKDGGIDALVTDIHKFAEYYRAVALDGESNKRLAGAFNELRELEAGVSYPLLLKLYDGYKHGLLTSIDLENAIRLVESYIFRRAVCGRPPNSHDQIFAACVKNLEEGRYLKSIKEYLLSMTGKREFPKDTEFEDKFSDHHYLKDKYWLHRLENHDRKEKKTYTIEHIMPRTLSDEWKDNLGSDWTVIHDRYLDSPGNLTLTGYNQEYSNRHFKEKRDMSGGFRESPLKLNEGLGKIDRWDARAIEKRAKRLSRMAVCTWVFPPSPNSG